MSVLARAKQWWTSLSAMRDALAMDADWYLATYPDVKASGANPRLHYLRYGRAEGRRPYLRAKTPYLAYSPRHASADRLGEQLWAGFAHSVVPELEALAKGGDGRAAWHLALWAYANGQLKDAQHWLQNAVAPAGEAQKKLAQAKCVAGVSLSEPFLTGVKRALTDVEQTLTGLARADRALMEVNLEQTLAPLNRLYRAHGLTELVLRDADEPLSLDNLRGAQRLEDRTPQSAQVYMPSPPRYMPSPPRRRGSDSTTQSVQVSVVMCAHNAAQTLPSALESVLAQTWQNLEVLVVDDASTDQTAAVVQAYQARDARVQLLRNAENLGAYGARNRGARAAGGAFITVHDCDDWSHPEKLARQLAPLLKNPAHVASASRWVRVRAPFRMVGSWQLNQGFLEHNPSSWLVRRSVFERMGYWDEVKVGADSEFTQRLEHHYGPEALVTVMQETPLAFARLSAETLTQQTGSHLRTQFYGLRRIYFEAAHWWHRASGGAPVMPEGRDPFPRLLGSIIGAPRQVDRVVVANFALQDQPSLPGLLEHVEALYRQDAALCLLHWPDITAWSGNAIADEVFEWAQRNGVCFAHPGLTLEAEWVHLLQPLEWRRRPSPTVALPNLRAVLDVDGKPYEPKAPWLDYFRAGEERS